VAFLPKEGQVLDVRCVLIVHGDIVVGLASASQVTNVGLVKLFVSKSLSELLSLPDTQVSYNSLSLAVQDSLKVLLGLPMAYHPKLYGLHHWRFISNLKKTRAPDERI
jgi:hypothetical protein